MNHQVLLVTEPPALPLQMRAISNQTRALSNQTRALSTQTRALSNQTRALSGQVDPRRGCFLAAGLLLRGDATASDAQRSLGRLKPGLSLPWWNPDAFKIGLCAAPPVGQPYALLVLSNNCAMAAGLKWRRTSLFFHYRTPSHRQPIKHGHFPIKHGHFPIEHGHFPIEHGRSRSTAQQLVESCADPL